tara:strand:- start:4867 stop:5085 length:219 start_codon:yes stop_codon:yes gene_type:complete
MSTNITLHDAIEMFRPVDTKEQVVDSSNETWTRFTESGWIRESDKFFWPFNPITSKPPCVEAISQNRKLMNK